ncbi:hypothetical protein HK102_013399 [Quaeritorhiza haematococci]|nr:hypothetical protein HK102_013399 [Quaeritorhiza haematococci]
MATTAGPASTLGVVEPPWAKFEDNLEDGKSGQQLKKLVNSSIIRRSGMSEAGKSSILSDTHTVKTSTKSRTGSPERDESQASERPSSRASSISSSSSSASTTDENNGTKSSKNTRTKTCSKDAKGKNKVSKSDSVSNRKAKKKIVATSKAGGAQAEVVVEDGAIGDLDTFLSKFPPSERGRALYKAIQLGIALADAVESGDKELPATEKRSAPVSSSSASASTKSKAKKSPDATAVSKSTSARTGRLPLSASDKQNASPTRSQKPQPEKYELLAKAALAANKSRIYGASVKPPTQQGTAAMPKTVRSSTHSHPPVHISDPALSSTPAAPQKGTDELVRRASSAASARKRHTIIGGVSVGSAKLAEVAKKGVGTLSRSGSSGRGRTRTHSSSGVEDLRAQSTSASRERPSLWEDATFVPSEGTRKTALTERQIPQSPTKTSQIPKPGSSPVAYGVYPSWWGHREHRPFSETTTNKATRSPTSHQGKRNTKETTKKLSSKAVTIVENVDSNAEEDDDVEEDESQDAVETEEADDEKAERDRKHDLDGTDGVLPNLKFPKRMVDGITQTSKSVESVIPKFDQGDNNIKVMSVGVGGRDNSTRKLDDDFAIIGGPAISVSRRAKDFYEHKTFAEEVSVANQSKPGADRPKRSVQKAGLIPTTDEDENSLVQASSGPLLRVPQGTFDCTLNSVQNANHALSMSVPNGVHFVHHHHHHHHHHQDSPVAGDNPMAVPVWDAGMSEAVVAGTAAAIVPSLGGIAGRTVPPQRTPSPNKGGVMMQEGVDTDGAEKAAKYATSPKVARRVSMGSQRYADQGEEEEGGGILNDQYGEDEEGIDDLPAAGSRHRPVNPPPKPVAFDVAWNDPGETERGGGRQNKAGVLRRPHSMSSLAEAAEERLRRLRMKYGNKKKMEVTSVAEMKEDKAPDVDESDRKVGQSESLVSSSVVGSAADSGTTKISVLKRSNSAITSARKSLASAVRVSGVERNSGKSPLLSRSHSFSSPGRGGKSVASSSVISTAAPTPLSAKRISSSAPSVAVTKTKGAGSPVRSAILSDSVPAGGKQSQSPRQTTKQQHQQQIRRLSSLPTALRASGSQSSSLLSSFRDRFTGAPTATTATTATATTLTATPPATTANTSITSHSSHTSRTTSTTTPSRSTRASHIDERKNKRTSSSPSMTTTSFASSLGAESSLTRSRGAGSVMSGTEMSIKMSSKGGKQVRIGDRDDRRVSGGVGGGGGGNRPPSSSSVLKRKDTIGAAKTPKSESIKDDSEAAAEASTTPKAGKAAKDVTVPEKSIVDIAREFLSSEFVFCLNLRVLEDEEEEEEEGMDDEDGDDEGTDRMGGDDEDDD